MTSMVRLGKARARVRAGLDFTALIQQRSLSSGAAPGFCFALWNRTSHKCAVTRIQREENQTIEPLPRASGVGRSLSSRFLSSTAHSSSVTDSRKQNTLSRALSGLQSRFTVTGGPSQIRSFSKTASWLQERDAVRKDETGKETSSSTSTKSPNQSTPGTILPKHLLPLVQTHENIYTLPNALTFSRLLSAPIIGYFVLTHSPVAALSLFAYAGFTDLIDGYLARRFNSQTVVGTVIDPMADKILMTTCVITLTMNGTLPIWLAVIILGRDVGLAISAIYFRWISLPPPKTMSRYWDFSLPSAEVHPTEISKINTFLQLLLIGNAMLLPVLPTGLVEMWNLWGVMEGWYYLVGGTTLWSGLSYVGNRDAVKILTQEQAEEKKKKKKQGGG